MEGKLVPLTASSAPPATPNNYLYAGEQWDKDLGLYYLRARYYHPEIGRFWTMDTYKGNPEDPLSLHKYLCCHADPVNRTDPSGHMTVIGVSIGSTISGSLSSMYNGGVSTVGFALMDTARGIAEGKKADEIIPDCWFNTAVGLGIGLGVGKVVQFADGAVYGGEFAIRGGVSRRLHSLLKDY